MATFAVLLQDNTGGAQAGWAVQVHRAPTTIPVGGTIIQQDSVWNNNAPTSIITITGATNATPIVLTVPTGHGIVAADEVEISGVLGNTAANGAFIVTSVTATTITLQGSAGNSAYTSGGKLRKLAQSPDPHVALNAALVAIYNSRSVSG